MVKRLSQKDSLFFVPMRNSNDLYLVIPLLQFYITHYLNCHLVFEYLKFTRKYTG